MSCEIILEGQIWDEDTPLPIVADWLYENGYDEKEVDDFRNRIAQYGRKTHNIATYGKMSFITYDTQVALKQRNYAIINVQTHNIMTSICGYISGSSNSSVFYDCYSRTDNVELKALVLYMWRKMLYPSDDVYIEFLPKQLQENVYKHRQNIHNWITSQGE